jgi:hypothetical protein
MNALTGFTLQTKDDQIGQVVDFYFDDQAWLVRYLIAEINAREMGREVLISRSAFGQIDRKGSLFPVQLNKQQVEHSPDINRVKPVSRQQKTVANQHSQWPIYWLMSGSIYHYSVPRPAILEAMLNDETQTDTASTTGETQEKDNPHLRSVGEVCGYKIQAQDGEIGCVEDFIVDDQGWRICYLVIKTRNWWRSKRVLVAPMWVEQINCLLKQVRVNLKRETISNSPKFDPKAPFDQAYEARIHSHYNQSD